MAEAEAWVMIPKLDKDKTGCVLEMRPLVLCKDCKHAEHCEIYAGWDGKHLDWFCADGERKEGGEVE